MLHRLIAGDDPPEGVAAHGIVLGHLQTLVGAAGLFEGQQHGRPVEHLLHQGKAFSGLAQAAGRSAGEGQAGDVAGRVKAFEGLALDEVGAGHVDQEQAGLAALVGQHHRDHRVRAVGDRDLGPAQLAVLDLAGQGRGVGDAGAFGGGEAADPFAGRDLGQDKGLLLPRAGQHHRLGDEIDRRGEGDRGGDPAHLLGDGAELHVAQAQAAEFLGDRRAQPALLGHALPQLDVMGDVVVVEHLADRGAGAAGLHELARLVLEELLVVGIVEIHSCLPPRV